LFFKNPKAKSKTQQTRMEKTRKRKREWEEKSPLEGLEFMERDQLQLERAWAEARLSFIEEREEELDGRDLWATCKHEIQQEAWYQHLDQLVLPGCGDDGWIVPTKRLLSVHLCRDLWDVVLGYAKQTVKEACDVLLDSTKITRHKEPDGFKLTVSCEPEGSNGIKIDAFYIERKDSEVKCDISIVELVRTPRYEQTSITYLYQVATALQLHGVVPLVLLAAILFRPIASVALEIEDQVRARPTGWMSDEVENWLMSSDERDVGVDFLCDLQGLDPPQWSVLKDDTSIKREVFDKLCDVFV
jgi:hypothetical protein